MRWMIFPYETMYENVSLLEAVKEGFEKVKSWSFLKQYSTFSKASLRMAEILHDVFQKRFFFIISQFYVQIDIQRVLF